MFLAHASPAKNCRSGCWQPRRIMDVTTWFEAMRLEGLPRVVRRPRGSEHAMNAELEPKQLTRVSTFPKQENAATGREASDMCTDQTVRDDCVDMHGRSKAWQGIERSADSRNSSRLRDQGTLNRTEGIETGRADCHIQGSPWFGHEFKKLSWWLDKYGIKASTMQIQKLLTGEVVRSR